MSYIILKCPLKNISFLDVNQSSILDSAITYCHQLSISVSFFLRLWILEKYHSKENISTITKETIQRVFGTLSIKSGNNTKSKKPIAKELNSFYNKNKDLFEKIPAARYTNIFAYLSGNILTDFENTIKKNFFKAFNLFINTYFEKNFKTRKELYSATKLIKNDFIYNTIESNKDYHKFLNKFRDKIFPELKESNHYLQLEKNPQQYLQYLIFINLELEKLGKKTFQIFPVRTGGMPKYIPLDTTILIDLFVTENKQAMKEDIESSKKLWNELFYLDDLYKGKKWMFDYRILTDGVGCSVQYVTKEERFKKDVHQKKLKEARAEARERKASVYNINWNTSNINNYCYRKK